MDRTLIRAAREAGYHVHYLQPTAIAAAAAKVLGNLPHPAFAVLRKD